MRETSHLTEAEEKLAVLLWRNAPLSSPDLVALAAREMGWKKSTTYTVLKKLCDKGVFKNENANVSVVLTRDEQIAVSVSPITEGMDTRWQAYDLFAEDGSVSVLILRKSDHDFTAVLNYAGQLIGGLVDNEVMPALFVDGKNKFEIGGMDDQYGTLIEDDRAIRVMGRKAVHMTLDGYNAWVAAGENDAEVYDFAERVIYTPIGKAPDEQMYMRIDDYKAWAAAGERDEDVSDFAVPFA